MYVDTKPASIYNDMAAIAPSPPGMLRRPPAVRDNSSSASSLSGMERAVPSFRTFVKRTPPPDTQKQLPPVPFVPRRASTTPAPSTRPPSMSTRRSSSVYSRTASQWFPSAPSWQTEDFADSKLYLRPVAYSASTPQLVEKVPTPPLLQPRAYNPLILSPSPTATSPDLSRRSTPSSMFLSSEPRPSILLPPPPGHVSVPKKLVSLEQAKADMQSPGAVHLLPEEMRAQVLGRSRSQEPLRIMSQDFFYDRRGIPPELPALATLVDSEGRDRLIPSPRSSVMSPPFSALLDVPNRTTSDGSFSVGKELPRTMLSLANQARKISKAKVMQSLGLNDPDEAQPRGRTRRRSPVGPRQLDYSHYLPQKSKSSDDEDSENESEARRLAKDYHNMLTEEYRRPSEVAETDENIKAEMKLVPQPLFHYKPSAKLPSAHSRGGSESSVSPFQLRRETALGRRQSTDRKNSRKSSFPLTLSLSPGSIRDERRSTSGSIPISPPSASVPRTPTVLPVDRAQTGHQNTIFRRSSEDGRVSAFYPHIMTRKGAKSSEKMSSSSTPAPALLAADIIAQRLKTPDGTPDSSTINTKPEVNRISYGSNSGSSTSRTARPMYKRIAKGAAKWAEELTRPTNDVPSEDRDQYQPVTPVAASPGSPHLLPSPKKPAPLHSGIVHTIRPAKPLDDSRSGMRESEASGRVRSGLFSNVIEFRRESKAVKRREELKKMIRIVPEGAETTDGGKSFSSKRWSDDQEGWM